MSLKLNVNVLFAIGLTFVAAVYAKSSDFIEHNPEFNLMNFMSRSNHIMQRNSLHAIECFEYYIPLITERAKQYETDLNGCCNVADGERSNTDDATLESRNNLENRTKESCDLIIKCNVEKSVDEVYRCYINGGSASSKLNYGISSDASEELVAYTEKRRVIQNNEYKCTNDTKRIYEKDSEKAYIDFDICLQGGEVPTTTTTSTTTTSTTTESTTTTEQSTEASSTEAPDSFEDYENSKQGEVEPQRYIDQIGKYFQTINELKQNLYD